MCFERGYEAADLRTIARVADVDPGLVHCIHFGSKAGLWEACVGAIVAQAAMISGSQADRIGCNGSR